MLLFKIVHNEALDPLSFHQMNIQYQPYVKASKSNECAEIASRIEYPSGYRRYLYPECIPDNDKARVHE